MTGKEKEQYHVYYRVHVSEQGWLGWTKDGEAARTRNYGLKIKAMQVCILPENSDKDKEGRRKSTVLILKKQKKNDILKYRINKWR